MEKSSVFKKCIWVVSILLMCSSASHVSSQEIQTNISDSFEISYQVFTLRGSVTNATDSIRVISPQGDTSWRVNDNREFVAFIELSPGENEIQFIAENNQTRVQTIDYNPKLGGPSVKFSYILPSDGDGEFMAPTGFDNDLDSAKNRFKTQALLMQSLFADLMYDAGYGYSTFRIELPQAKPEEIIHITRTNVPEAEYLNYNDYQNTPEADQYDKYNFFRFYSFLQYQVTTSPNRIKHFVMAGMSQVDDLGNRFASAALGGGDMALVGNLTLYSVPENISDLSTQAYDTDIFFDIPNQPQKLNEAMAQLIGASIHELGHSLGLSHIDLNRSLVLSGGTPTSSSSAENRYNVESDSSGIMSLGFYGYHSYKLFAVEDENGQAIPSNTRPKWNWGYVNTATPDRDDRIQNSGDILFNSAWINTASELNEITLEAENAVLSGATKVVEDPSASNSGLVIWFNDEIAFPALYVSGDAQTVQFDIHYRSHEQRQAQLLVNDQSPLTLSFSAGNTIGETSILQVTTSLSNGANSISLVAYAGWGPDIDKIVAKADTLNQVYYSEAEAATNTISGQGEIAPSTLASGGYLVKNLGGDITFSSTSSAIDKGLYQIDIGYRSYEDRYSTLDIEHSLNTAALTLDYPATEALFEVYSIRKDIFLDEGRSTITLGHNAKGEFWMPDIDYVQISKNTFFTKDNYILEAEDSNAVLSGGSIVKTKVGASNGEILGLESLQGTVTYPNILAESSGYYYLDFYYYSGDTRYASMTINNGDASLLLFPGNNDWSEPQNTTVRIYLNEGYNTLSLQNSGNIWMPDFDKMKISKE